MKLTARQLERLLTKQTRYSENTRAMERVVLVDGKSRSAVGARQKVSRQSAPCAATQVYRAYLDAVDWPEG